MSRLRILVTGSREWADQHRIRRALGEALGTYASIGLPVLIHGGARGADLLADQAWRQLQDSIRLAAPAVYHAHAFRSPRERNQFMVDAGATVCLAFATSWASGTGMCARMARKAGIPVRDYGVPTALEARP